MSVTANDDALPYRPAWSDAQKERLKQLWYQNPQLSHAEIARMMNTTANAVAGHAHRMKLKPRAFCRAGQTRIICQ